MSESNESEVTRNRHTVDSSDSNFNTLEDGNSTSDVNPQSNQPEESRKNVSVYQSNVVFPPYISQAGSTTDMQLVQNTHDMPKPSLQLSERQQQLVSSLPFQQNPMKEVPSIQINNEQFQPNLKPNASLIINNTQNLSATTNASVSTNPSFSQQQVQGPTEFQTSQYGDFSHQHNVNYAGHPTGIFKFQQIPTTSLTSNIDQNALETAMKVNLSPAMYQQGTVPYQIHQPQALQSFNTSNLTSPTGGEKADFSIENRGTNRTHVFAPKDFEIMDALQSDLMKQKASISVLPIRDGLYSLPGQNLSIMRHPESLSSLLTGKRRQGRVTNTDKKVNQETIASQKGLQKSDTDHTQKDSIINKDEEDMPNTKKIRVEDKIGQSDKEKDPSTCSTSHTTSQLKTIDTSTISDPEELLAVKKQIAREKNRVHSRKSRLRKKDSITKMKDENAELQLYKVILEAVADMISLHDLTDEASSYSRIQK